MPTRQKYTLPQKNADPAGATFILAIIQLTYFLF